MGSKDSRRSKKRKRETDAETGEQLLIAAALGEFKACKKLIKRQDADVNYVDAVQITTPLHEVSANTTMAACTLTSGPMRHALSHPVQACRHGHLDVVDLLLKHGGVVDAQDLQGNTPGHLAAKNKHLLVVSALLQSRRPPNLALRNDQGISLHSLVTAALDEGEKAQGEASASDRAGHRDDGVRREQGMQFHGINSYDNEFDWYGEQYDDLPGRMHTEQWQGKLQQEMGMEEPEAWGA